MLAEAISTVAGRLMIIFFCGVGLKTSPTAAQMSRANSSSVPVKLSGEYSNTHSVLGSASASCFTSLAADTAMSTMPL